MREKKPNSTRYNAKCEGCGEVFETTRTDSTTCGYRCRKRVYRKNQNGFHEIDKIPGWIYAAASEDGLVKLGRSTDVEGRVRELRTFSQIKDLQMVAIKEVSDTVAEEMRIHGLFWDRHIGREWFDISIHEAVQAVLEDKRDTSYLTVEECYWL